MASVRVIWLGREADAILWPVSCFSWRGGNAGRDGASAGRPAFRHSQDRTGTGGQRIGRRAADWTAAGDLVVTVDRADITFAAGADISYIWTAEGWLYLAVVLDLFSRRVVGWVTSDRLKRDLAVEALRRALVARNPAPGLVHHSDRGSQYCSVDYQALLRKRGILISMSGRGTCYDNSMVETFFKTIKSELVWPVAWQSRKQAENAVARYIDGFYNPVRRHSSRGFQSPIAFERKAGEVS